MDQTLIINVLIVAIAATVVLLVLAVVVPRLRRDRSDVSFAPLAPAPLSARLGQAAFAGGGPSFGVGVPTMGTGREFVSSTPGPDAAAAIESAAHDGTTGLLLLPMWNRVLADEDARIRRYRRPATVVMLDIDGLDRLIERLGPEAADRLIPAVAETLRRSARSADHIARLGHGRFAALLPETDEVQAINYVERVRRACDLWLESGAIALRLAIGWSSTSGDIGLPDAQRIAGERMFAEVHRHARRAADALAHDDAPGAPGREPGGSRAI